jgi:non-ribosomal peptide synthetase component F
MGATSKTAQFPLTLAMSEAEERIGGGLTYSTELFNDDTISEMIDRFVSLLEGVIAHPDWRLLEIPLDKNEPPNLPSLRANLQADLYEAEFTL